MSKRWLEIPGVIAIITLFLTLVCGLAPAQAQDGTGLAADYFDNSDLTNLVLSRVDATVNFDWGYNAPAGFMGADTFSVRWSGQVKALYTQTYTFTTLTDDGARLYVNGQLIVDNWTNQTSSEASGNIALVAGQKYSIVMEYYDNTGAAVASLSWACSSQPKQIIPQGQLYPPNLLPTVALTAPGNLQDFSAPATIALAATAADSDGTITKVEFYNGAVKIGEDTSSPYTLSWSGVAAGNYSLTAHAIDNNPATSISAPVAISVAAPTGTGTGLEGDYFDNSDFTAQLLSRTDPTINFDWMTGSPDPAIGPDTFSVRWTGQVEPRFSETYSFTTRTDDGVRLWINDQQLINDWVVQSPTDMTANCDLVAGQKVNLKIEYFENASGASAKLYWASASQGKEIVPQAYLTPPSVNGTGTGLTGKYYTEIKPLGTDPYIPQFTNLKTTQTDPTVNFNWGYNRPVPAVNPDYFSARWTGQVQPRYSETYTFYVDSDDGARLWVNGQPLINTWDAHRGFTSGSGTVTLAAGQKYDLWLEYKDEYNQAQISLSWSSNSQAKEVVPQTQLYPNSVGNHPPTATITGPLDSDGLGGKAYVAPASFTVTADAADPDGTITKVEFYSNGVKLGEDSTAPYTLAIANLGEGTSKLTAKAIDNGNTATISTPLRVEVYALKPGPSQFVIGVWAQPVRSTTEIDTTLPDGTIHRSWVAIDMAKWLSRGINTMVGYDPGPNYILAHNPPDYGDSVATWMTAAQAQGLHVMRLPNTMTDVSEQIQKGRTNTHPTDITKLQADATAAGGTLRSWAHPDEPDLYDPVVDPTILKTNYDAMQAASPTIPVYINFAGPRVVDDKKELYQTYLHAADWVGHDIYPANNVRAISVLGDHIDKLRLWSAGKPQFAHIESSFQHLKVGGVLAPGTRKPTPQEMTAEIWSTVVHGVSGIIYFPQRVSDGFQYDDMPAESPELELVMTAQDARLALLAPDAGTRLTGLPAGFEGCQRNYAGGGAHTIVVNLTVDANGVAIANTYNGHTYAANEVTIDGATVAPS